MYRHVCDIHIHVNNMLATAPLDLPYGCTVSLIHPCMCWIKGHVNASFCWEHAEHEVAAAYAGLCCKSCRQCGKLSDTCLEAFRTNEAPVDKQSRPTKHTSNFNSLVSTAYSTKLVSKPLLGFTMRIQASFWMLATRTATNQGHISLFCTFLVCGFHHCSEFVHLSFLFPQALKTSEISGLSLL